MHIGENMNKNDKKLIVGCLIFALIALGIYYIIQKNHQGEIGIVEYKDDILLEFDLDKDDIYEFKGTNGIVHLEVKEGRFRVFDVECPNHDCEQMGWHDKESLTPIVCLPNEIIIYTSKDK